MKGLTIRIGERTLLEALDYVVHRGDKLIIAGPNGTGKSTLLRCATMLETMAVSYTHLTLPTIA